MDALELLKSWPDWERAGTETVLASPAWRLPVRVNGAAGVMTAAEPAERDLLVFDVTLDGEAHRLALADSPAYPDLHLLWSRRAELPEALLLALAEKECGGVFALVESVTRRLFAVKGLSADADGLRFFAVSGAGGDFVLGLDVTPDLAAGLGRLENLDPAHPSIRTSTRPARAVSGLLMLTDEELAALEPGSFVLLPEAFGQAAKWATLPELEASEALAVAVPGEVALAFAAFADETFPPVPAGDAFEILRGGRCLFRCVAAQVGQARALKVVEKGV